MHTYKHTLWQHLPISTSCWHWQIIAREPSKKMCPSPWARHNTVGQGDVIVFSKYVAVDVCMCMYVCGWTYRYKYYTRTYIYTCIHTTCMHSFTQYIHNYIHTYIHTVVAEAVIRAMSKKLAGSGILVFVSGMADITDLNERYIHTHTYIILIYMYVCMYVCMYSKKTLRVCM